MSQESLNRTKAFPWWASVLAGGLSYALLTYLPPRLSPASEALQKICDFAPHIAPLIAIPFLLLGAKQLYDIPSADAQEKDDPQSTDQN